MCGQRAWLSRAHVRAAGGRGAAACGVGVAAVLEIMMIQSEISSIEYPRMSASGESSTTMHRLLHASGSHPIPTPYDPKNLESSTCVTLNGSGIQLAVGPQPLWLRNHNPGLAHRIMDVRASGNTALSSPCWDRSHHAPSG
ncbi:hypothetical protein F511_39417 [Dorcoceras hygrometricum]|uniref:Uncharacterized protein n=1 Tax=Dorcoceras hygrometricum TaxID=472368 RepID=A0A2Z7CSU9_9LAMI|nr:hypothetical protein F511_39417 [Dorcoceras hygrometricum]